MDTVYRSPQAASRPTVVTIGNFDGAHLGHQTVFDQVRQQAAELGARPTVLTFEPHPVRHFRPSVEPFRLVSPAHKFRLIEGFGLDVVALRFDANVASLTPEAFVDGILVAGLQAKHVFVGAGFRFAQGRSGTTAILTELGQAAGFTTAIIEPVTLGDDPMSSTRVRDHLRKAELDAVARLLGRRHSVLGEVVHGDARGRGLGFPTANIDTANLLLPPDGIYAAWLHREGEPSPRQVAGYIGTRPTFATGVRALEAYVLDVPDDEELDLYGELVEFEFVSHIRPDEAFESPEALSAQINRDIEACRRALAG